MLYPRLKAIPSTRDVVSAFGGYDHRLVIPDGAFFDENNLTSDNYPVLSTRAEHGIHLVAKGAVKAILDTNELCYVEGNTVHIGDKTVTAPNSSWLDNVKQMVSMGIYLIILDRYGNLIHVNTQTLEIDLLRLKFSSTNYGDDNVETYYYATDESGVYPYSEKPNSPKAGDLYRNVAENRIERYNGYTWVEVPTRISISAPGIQSRFHVGDYVYISGISSGGAHFDMVNGKQTIIAIGKTTMGTKEIDFITLDVAPSNVGADFTSAEVVIERRQPSFDYICVSGNRLWGCRYGMQGKERVNEIYASKLGDFKDFDYKPNTAADSYSVSLGSDGKFTGAITYQGNPIFFKEGVIHRIIGNAPSNYQMQTTECQGVKDGSYRSLATVDNILFYQAPSGIYAYDGSLPQSVFSAFGNVKYSDAVGGAYLRKYYVNMKNADGVYATFVYDINNGIWHKQDEGGKVDMFAPAENALYYAVVNTIYTMFGKGEADKAPIPWYAETGIIGTDLPDKKYLSRITLSLSLVREARLMIFIEYDSSGEWTHAATLTGHNLSSFSIPISIERCNHFRIRLKGTGECRIYSITKTMERGSEE